MKVICIVLFISFIGLGQDLPPKLSPTEKFNERGYVNSASFSSSGHEIISDYDGNLSYLYTSKVTAPGNMGGDITITYNANVEHTVFFYMSNITNPHGYSVNSPEWILGYKGFALQVFTSEDSWYSYKAVVDSIKNLWGDQVAFHIPGYDYCNLPYSTSNTIFAQEINKDKITLLMSDGSKKILIHKESESLLKTGEYFEASPNATGFAFVDTIPGTNGKFRTVSYKPGDGLTYFFEEALVNFDRYDTNSSRPPATTMYLTKVYSAIGDTIVFEYTGAPGSVEITKGRRYFDNCHMTDNSCSTVMGLFNVSYFAFPMETGSPSIRMVDINNCRKAIGLTPITLGLRDRRYFMNSSSPNTSTKRQDIIFIRDEEGNEDNFSYLPITRNFYQKNGNDPIVFRFQQTSWLIHGAAYNDKKVSIFSYLNQDISIPNINFENKTLSSQYGLHVFPLKTLRDDYANFMIDSVSKYNSINEKLKLIYTEKYEYGVNPDTNQYCILDNIVRKGMTTVVTKNDRSGDITGSSHPTVKTTKIFNRYPRAFSISQTSDFRTEIKLMNEITECQDKFTSVNYYWDYGEINSNYYIGSFKLKREVLGISDDSGLNYRTQKDISYSYKLHELYKNAYFCSLYATSDMTKTDSINHVINKTIYNDTFFNPSNSNYQVDVVQRELQYISAGDTTLDNCISYLQDSPFKVFQIVDNVKRVHKSFYYYNEGPPVDSNISCQYPNLHKYTLKSTVFENGAAEYYRYKVDTARTWMYDWGGYVKVNYDTSGVIIGQDTVYKYPPKWKWFYCMKGATVYSDGTIDTTKEYMDGISLAGMPFETTISFDGQNMQRDTLTRYTAYLNGGEPSLKVDMNGYLTSMMYDAKGRLTSVISPSGYSKQNDILDTIFIKKQSYYRSNCLRRLNEAGSFGNADTFYVDDYKKLVLYRASSNADSLNMLNQIQSDASIGLINDSLVFSKPPLPDEDLDDDPGTNPQPVFFPDPDPEPIPVPDETAQHTSYNSYIYFDHDLCFDDIVDIKSAKLTIKTKNGTWTIDNTSIQMPLNFDINILTGTEKESYDSHRIRVEFQRNTLLTIDLTELLKYYIGKNVTINGLRLSADCSSNVDFLAKSLTTKFRKTLHFDETFNPDLFVIYTKKIEVDRASFNIAYNDLQNSATIVKRISMNDTTSINQVTKIDYDGFGQLRKTSILGADSVFHTKDSLDYNYLGLQNYQADALHHVKFAKYDALGRPQETIFGSETNSPSKKISYELLTGEGNEFEKTIYEDEEGKQVEKITDRYGNVLSSTIRNGSDSLVTSFTYDAYNRPLTVTSQKGLTTSYSYDKRGFMNQKHSPDDGITSYKYDKYGNLRFWQNSGDSLQAEQTAWETSHPQTNNSAKTFNLHFFVEGLYNSETQKTVIDSAQIILAFGSDTLNWLKQNAAFDSSGNITATFQNILRGQFYIGIQYRSSIRTWSSVTFSDTSSTTFTYNFTDSCSRAFGGNQILKDNNWCFYSGDVDQDGYIGLFDLTLIDNDAFYMLEGTHLATDLDGDGLVSNVDLTICDNNAFYGVCEVLPDFSILQLHNNIFTTY